MRLARRLRGDGIEITETAGVRTLHLGSGAIQSAMRVSRPWDLELAYTRAMMAFLLFVPEPARVTMLGLGGGSLAKFIRRHRPETRITAVEIDARVIAAARLHFALPDDDATLTVVQADAADYIPAHPGESEVILLDGFDAGHQVPGLATGAFYEACRRALTADGVLAVNFWGRDRDYPEYARRLAEAFDGAVATLSVHDRTNVIAFAFAAGKVPAVPDGCPAALGARWGLDFARYARELVPGRGVD